MSSIGSVLDVAKGALGELVDKSGKSDGAGKPGDGPKNDSDGIGSVLDQAKDAFEKLLGDKAKDS